MLSGTKRNSYALFAALLVLALAIPALSALAAPGAAPAAQAGVAADTLSWQQVHQAPAGQYFYGLYFPTRDVGYAVSGPDWNNDKNGSGAPTYVTKTTDGGKTWVSTAIANTDGWMRGLTCTDANNCWVAGKAKGRILRTTNGGQTWGTIANSSGYPNWLWSAGYTGKGTTILAGTTCYDPNDTDAVANWLRATDGQSFKGVVARPGVNTCFVQWDIECPAAGFCYSVGKDYVWRSSNDGVTWAGLSPGIVRWYGASCTSTSTCWVAGKSPFIKSTGNSGGSWTQAAVAGLSSTGQLWDVAMVNDQIGYAVGCDAMTTDNTDRCLGKGVILKTTDGLSWLPITSPTTADIMDIWLFGEGDVFLVDWSGKIWHGTMEPTPTPTATATHTPTATATPNTGVISGVVFEDSNDDAFREAHEPGVAGAVMALRRGSQEIATAVSDSAGVFRFTGVEPGQYTLRQKQAPPGRPLSVFLTAFDVTVNREHSFYVAQGPQEDTPTPSPTPTSTSEPTATATATHTPTQTATSTPTATRPAVSGYLPIIIH